MQKNRNLRIYHKSRIILNTSFQSIAPNHSGKNRDSRGIIYNFKTNILELYSVTKFYAIKSSKNYYVQMITAKNIEQR